MASEVNNADPTGRCHLIIAGARVIDGSGSAGFGADVAIDAGNISAIGDLSSWSADERIEAHGLTLTPGFIDVHTHDDLAVLKSPDMSCKISQGVTTVIAGNCGISLAPFVSGREFPPPFPLMGDEDEFRYPSVAAYRQQFELSPPSLNLALLVGHSSLRVGSMSDSLDRQANPDELEAMKSLLREALQQGCIGLSTGLDYPPAEAATTSEIIELAKVLSEFRYRIYASHIRNESDEVLQAVEEALEIGRKGGSPTVISHHKCAGSKNYGRSVETLGIIEQNRKSQAVALDVYPYTASSTSLLPQFIRDAEKVLITYSDPYPEMGGRDLAEVAGEFGCSMEQAAERLYPAGGIFFDMDEMDVQRIMAYPPTMIGSDGLPGASEPHPRLWGTFPRVLSRYVREKRTLTLESAVHKMTGLSAQTFGIERRGLIREGYHADLTLFDADTVVDTATYESPISSALGIALVLVDGEPVWKQGEHTGNRRGRFLNFS